MNRSPSETVPRAEEHPGTPLQQALTNLKQQVRDMQGTSHQYACACHAPAGHKLTTIRTTCGGLLHTLDSSLDVARTTPWLTHTEARF